jgi:hypothetical protein
MGSMGERKPEDGKIYVWMTMGSPSTLRAYILTSNGIEEGPYYPVTGDNNFANFQ